MNSSERIEIKPQISIGLPVYNAELFIHKKIKSLLEQTFTDFELIISDNGSTDSTSLICEEYAKKDKRIKYIKQEKNMGAVWNYNLVLKEAKCDYFLWVAADDILSPKFIEKNINILETKDNVICSVSRMKMFGKMTDYLEFSPNDSLFTQLLKRIKRNFAHMDSYPASGPYEKKVREFLKKCRHNQAFYGVYRTKQLQQCNATLESFLGSDTTFVLNLLRYGDLHVIDEVMMYTYDGGISRSGLIAVASHMNRNILGIVFPFYPFTAWCFKHLGVKNFVKNIDFFIEINLVGAISLVIDLIRLFRNKIRNF